MLNLAARSRNLAPCRNLSSTFVTLSDATGASTSAADGTSLSAASSVKRQWNRPLEPGVNKAYDEALALIRRDSNRKIAELRRLQKSSENQPKEQMRKLEIDSRINLPEVHWNIKHGQGKLKEVNASCQPFLSYHVVDMTDPVHRHLVERQWRKEGKLDRLVSNWIIPFSLVTEVLIIDGTRPPDVRPPGFAAINASQFGSADLFGLRSWHSKHVSVGP
jgi:hypothetical protein